MCALHMYLHRDSVRRYYACPSLLLWLCVITTIERGRGGKTPKQALAHDGIMKVLKLCFFLHLGTVVLLDLFHVLELLFVAFPNC